MLCCPPICPACPSYPSFPPQAGDAHFEAAYGLIQEAVAHMSAEESAKEIKQMKPTVSGWCLLCLLGRGWRLAGLPAVPACLWSFVLLGWLLHRCLGLSTVAALVTSKLRAASEQAPDLLCLLCLLCCACCGCRLSRTPMTPTARPPSSSPCSST